MSLARMYVPKQMRRHPAHGAWNARVARSTSAFPTPSRYLQVMASAMTCGRSWSCAKMRARTSGGRVKSALDCAVQFAHQLSYSLGAFRREV